MSYHQTGTGPAEDAVCQYDVSKRWFRGPQRHLDGSYIACVGGDETFGRFVDAPFTLVLEQRLDQKCLNLGSLFCGVEALTQDSGLLELVNGSDMCVLQVPGALGQSNHFYRVHPRRNDRFLEPSRDLVDLYPEIDFTDVHFVHHLLDRLCVHNDARFDVVANELRTNWVRRMRDLLAKIEPPVILLWLRVQRQSEHEIGGVMMQSLTRVDSLLVKQLGALCADIVELPVRVSGESDELEDMLFGTLQQPLAEHVIGPSAHRGIAEELLKHVRDLK